MLTKSTHFDMYPLYRLSSKGGTYQNECFLLFLCMTYEYMTYALSVLLP